MPRFYWERKDRCATPFINDPDLTRRAFRAYFRASEPWADQPANYSGLTEWQGKQYVVLENCNGPLAVYRVRTDGRLMRLVSWPAEVSER